VRITDYPKRPSELTIVSLVGHCRQTEFLVVVENALSQTARRPIVGIGRSQDLVAKVVPAQVCGTPLDFVTVNGSIGSDEFGSHRHEKSIEDVQAFGTNGHQAHVKTATQLCYFGLLPGVIESGGIAFERGTGVQGVAGTALFQDRVPGFSKGLLELVFGDRNIFGREDCGFRS